MAVANGTTVNGTQATAAEASDSDPDDTDLDDTDLDDTEPAGPKPIVVVDDLHGVSQPGIEGICRSRVCVYGSQAEEGAAGQRQACPEDEQEGGDKRQHDEKRLSALAMAMPEHQMHPPGRLLTLSTTADAPVADGWMVTVP